MSWLARQSNRTKKPLTTIAIGGPRADVNQSANSSAPPPASETPRSSASSLCSCGSCEHHHGTASSSSAGISASSPLCSISSKGDQSEASTQLSSVTSLDNQISAECWLNDSTRSLAAIKHKGGSETLPELGCGQALALGSEDKELTSEKRNGRGEELITAARASNRRDLIDKPDEALKGGGSALAEDDMLLFTSNSYNETPKLPLLQQTEDYHVSQPTVLKRSRKRRFMASPLAPPRRTTSVKRKKSKKVKPVMPHAQRKAKQQAGKHRSRWSLSENIAELIGSKLLLSRIEADEMLTPEQLEMYKAQRRSQLQLQTQKEAEKEKEKEREYENEDQLPTFDPESLETPLEPFHMDDLPSRIGSSGVRLTENTPVDRIVPEFSEEMVVRDFSIDRDGEERPAHNAYEGLGCPLPPTRQQQQQPPPRLIARKPLHALPSIPESSTPATVLPTPKALRLQHHSDDELFFTTGFPTSPVKNDADSEYFFLRSTPYTLTQPAFRHGPIRLAKADLGQDPKLAAEEGLDWTAFQMAILGGAGDWSTESEDTIRQLETEELDDICEWWDSWNLSIGGLVTREVEVEVPEVKVTDSNGDYTDISTDNPYKAHRRWQRQRRKAAAEGRSLDLTLRPHSSRPSSRHGDPTKKDPAASHLTATDTRRWTTEGEGKNVVDRESVASLPDSPMLELRIVTADNGDVDYVPMGYNLGHDLGDYLQWEAEHVYSDYGMYQGGVI